MSLATFGGIKAEVALRMARSDKTAQIPGFIQIAHGKMMRGHKRGRDWLVPPLRFDGMLQEADLTPSEGVADLPTDFLQAKQLVTDTLGAPPLRFMPQSQFKGSGLYTSSGIPQFYTIEAGQILIMPKNTNVLTLDYYGLIATPSVDADTNAIMTTIPHAYLFGALAEAFAQARNMDMAAYYEAEFAGTIAAANETDSLSETSGDFLIARPGIIP